MSLAFSRKVSFFAWPQKSAPSGISRPSVQETLMKLAPLVMKAAVSWSNASLVPGLLSEWCFLFHGAQNGLGVTSGKDALDRVWVVCIDLRTFDHVRGCTVDRNFPEADLQSTGSTGPLPAASP